MTHWVGGDGGVGSAHSRITVLPHREQMPDPRTWCRPWISTRIESQAWQGHAAIGALIVEGRGKGWAPNASLALLTCSTRASSNSLKASESLSGVDIDASSGERQVCCAKAESVRMVPQVSISFCLASIRAFLESDIGSVDEVGVDSRGAVGELKVWPAT